MSRQLLFRQEDPAGYPEIDHANPSKIVGSSSLWVLQMWGILIIPLFCMEAI